MLFSKGLQTVLFPNTQFLNNSFARAYCILRIWKQTKNVFSYTTLSILGGCIKLATTYTRKILSGLYGSKESIKSFWMHIKVYSWFALFCYHTSIINNENFSFNNHSPDNRNNRKFNLPKFVEIGVNYLPYRIPIYLLLLFPNWKLR